MWKNLKNIQIPGSIWSPLLVGTMLGITGGLFITLPISRTNDNTLGESIFGKNESLELQIKIENEGELHLKATGATTMEVLTNLKQMLKNMEQNLLLEQSSPYTPL